MSMEKKKFKYLLSPENTYIIDYGDFSAEILGSEIMSILRTEKYLDYIITQDQSEDKL